MILPSSGVAVVIPEYIPIPGIDPYSIDSNGQFLISRDQLQHLEQYGPVQKFWDAPLVCNALEHPTVILEGLKRTNYDRGLCYCCVPTARWTSETEIIPPPPGKVFCVYVNPVVAGYFVLDWDWRSVGLRTSGIPDRWQRDFERIVWPTS
jgi:hypothetical protein